ncbi:MAG: SPOR domain-containing protein, partial [Oscillospiraceae bacterium]|nr:SPOR domain-containing protein [Oscillospiraceae bacterium]
TYGGDLYTHNYWCNVRNGKKGSIEALNKLDDGYKNCTVYIRPKWDSFTELVKSYRKNNTKLFYVQVGAFSSRENAEAYLAKVKKYYPGAFIKVM